MGVRYDNKNRLVCRLKIKVRLMDGFLIALNSVDKSTAIVITIFIVIAIVSTPFYLARFRDQKAWSEIQKTNGVSGDLPFRLLFIGRIVRHIERDGFFKKNYIALVLFLCVSGFFDIKNSLEMSGAIPYINIIITVVSILFPLLLWAGTVFSSKKTVTIYTEFKKALGVKKLNLPALMDLETTKITSLDESLFNKE